MTPVAEPVVAEPLLTPEEVAGARDDLERLLAGLRSAIFGQDDLLRHVVVCLVARGHMLLEGQPGLGKTELVKSLSALLDVPFRRIQFTPDLLPSDIVGSPLLEERDGGRRFVFHRGPVFSNLLLADEINRATPKTQSALLQAMQERQVTVMGETHDLPRPFFVLATQNPIELEGTYPLPEAQLDRFMCKINVGGVSPATLEQIVNARSTGDGPVLSPVLAAEDLDRLFRLADRVHLPVGVTNYIARLVSATHGDSPAARPGLTKYIRFGASPRAAIALAATARAAALLAGKPNAGFDEVKFCAASVLGHRLILDYAARLDGMTPANLVTRLLDEVPEVDRRLPEDLAS